MPRQQLRTDFVKADLDAGFALLRLAQSRSASGVPGDAHRALEEAETAYTAGRRRMAGLRGSGVAHLEAQAERLRQIIETVKSQLDAPFDVAQIIPRNTPNLRPRRARSRPVCIKPRKSRLITLPRQSPE